MLDNKLRSSRTIRPAANFSKRPPNVAPLRKEFLVISTTTSENEQKICRHASKGTVSENEVEAVCKIAMEPVKCSLLLHNVLDGADDARNRRRSHGLMGSPKICSNQIQQQEQHFKALGRGSVRLLPTARVVRSATLRSGVDIDSSSILGRLGFILAFPSCDQQYLVMRRLVIGSQIPFDNLTYVPAIEGHLKEACWYCSDRRFKQARLWVCTDCECMLNCTTWNGTKKRWRWEVKGPSL